MLTLDSWAKQSQENRIRAYTDYGRAVHVGIIQSNVATTWYVRAWDDGKVNIGPAHKDETIAGVKIYKY